MRGFGFRGYWSLNRINIAALIIAYTFLGVPYTDYTIV